MNSSLEHLSKEELIEQYIQIQSDQDTLQSNMDSLQSDKDSLQSDKDHLQFQYDQLRRLVFGTKRERFIKQNNPHQQSLPFEEQPVENAQLVKQKVSYEREQKSKRENHPGRNALPKHLPVEEVVIEPNVDTSQLIRIGQEVSERLEFIQAKLFVQRTIRPKYALPKAEQNEDVKSIIIAELPSWAIEKSIAGNSLLASLFIDKFVDHLPFYRQISRFKREQIDISSSTINGWQTQLTALLEPLYDCLKNKILSQGYIQTDESPIKVMDSKKKGKTHTGYHWVYYSPLERMVLFDYHPSRKRECVEQMLTDFKGYLQTDGYVAYDVFRERKGITLLGCMAHARRYFEKALDNDKARAEHVLVEMQKLYATEREAKQSEYTHEQRHAYRLKRSQPIMEALIKWLIKEQPATTPKSPIGKAIRYTIGQWEGLRAYLYDGALEIDNNLIENSIRTLAIGRKNYLFAGSHNGAKSAAMFYSFFGTCKKNDVNPYLWLKKVLDIIPEHKVNKLEELLPQNLKLE